MKLKTGITISLLAGLLAASSAQARPKGCAHYRLVTFVVHVAAGKIERLAVAPGVQELCGPLPQAGQENVVFELARGPGDGFRRPIHFIDMRAYDYHAPDGTRGGGEVPDPEPVLTTLVPEPLAGAMTLTRIKDGKLLARGKL